MTYTWIVFMSYNIMFTSGSRRPPCLKGWELSIHALLLVWEFLHEEYDLKFLLTGRINPDPVENLSSVITGKGGARDNPDSVQFPATLRQVPSCTCWNHSWNQQLKCSHQLDLSLYQDLSCIVVPFRFKWRPFISWWKCISVLAVTNDFIYPYN